MLIIDMIHSTYEVICYRIGVVYIFSREGFQSESSSRIGKCRGSSDDLTEVNAARSLGRSEHKRDIGPLCLQLMR